MSRRFLKPSQIPKYLYCSICFEVFRSPSRLSCTHTFCDECIKMWAQSKNSCPVCRKKIMKKSITQDLIANCVINDLEVICLHKGCNWTGRLEELQNHDQDCIFQPNQLDSTVAQKLPEKNFEEDQDIEHLESSLLAELYSTHKNLIERVYNEPEKKIKSNPFDLDDEETKEFNN